MRFFRNRLTYSNVTATLALVLALGTGGALAASQLIDTGDIEKDAITSKLIDNNQVKSKDIKDNKGVKGDDVTDGSLTGADIGAGAVGTAQLADGSVDSAKVADGSLVAGDLVAQEKFHLLNAAGEPALGNGVEGDCVWTNAQGAIPALNPPGFRIDRFGTVTMTGLVQAVDTAGVGDEECGATGPEPDDSGEDAVIFTLPPAYRPARAVVFPNTDFGLIIAGNETVVVGTDSLPPGTVFTTDPVVALDAVSYPAASASVLSARAPAAAEGAESASIGSLGELFGN